MSRACGDGTAVYLQHMTTLRDRLRAALRSAMLAKDAAAVGALRSALAALDNAEAVDAAPSSGPTVATHPRLAGTTVGVGAAEVERRSLSEDEQRAVLQAEVDERLAAAAQSDLGGRPDRAERLRAEAAVLAGPCSQE
jgi:uncharacterized protein YqeY